jgi:hypothetical protein
MSALPVPSTPTGTSGLSELELEREREYTPSIVAAAYVACYGRDRCRALECINVSL